MQMVIILSLFHQMLLELLVTQRDSNSSSSDLDSILVARKSKNGFNLVPSALAATHTLTIHFLCPVVLKQTHFAPRLWIVVLETM